MATKTSRPRLGFLIAAAFALSASVMPAKVKAADVYFDAVASPTGPSFFSYAGNWWTDSSSTVGTFPSSGDDLFFGFGSGNPDNTAIYSDLGPAFIFNSITFSNADGLGSRGFYATTGADILRTSIINSFLGAGNINFNLPEVELIGPFAYVAAGAGSSIVFTDAVSSASPSGLTVTGDGNTTISGSLSVNGLEKTGAGVLALGSGSYVTGFIDVLDGTVNFTQAGVMVDASVTNDSLLNFTNTSGVAGVSSLGGNGTTTFSGGASIASFSGTGTLSLNGNSSILSLSGNADVNIAINKTLEVASGSFSGNLSGLGDFKKVSDASPSGGTLVLDGNNIGLSGDILIEAGVVQSEFIWALGAGNIMLSGGDLTLVSNVNQTRANNVVVSADASITIEAFTPGTLSLTQQLGNLSIGANTLDVVQSPNFALGATSTLAFADVTLDSAGGTSTFNVVGDARLTMNNVTSFANESLTIDGAGTTVISGTLDLGTGNLTKNGSGDLFVVNAVSGTWNGSTSVNDGLLWFSSAVTLTGQVTNNANLRFADSSGLTELTTGLNGSGLTVFDGDALIGTRTGNGAQVLLGNTGIASLNGQGLIDIVSAKTLTVLSGYFNGTLQGGGDLVKTGGDVLIFGGSADYTGTTTVNAGSGALAFVTPVFLSGQVTNDSAIQFISGGGLTVLDAGLNGSGNSQFIGDSYIRVRDGNGYLLLQGDSTIGTLLGTGTISIDPQKTLDVSSGSFSGTLQGDGNLTKSGPGILVMSGLGVDDYLGTTTVIDGTLQFDSAVTLAGQVTNDSYLNFMASAGVTTLTTGLGGSGWTRFWGDAVIGQRSGSGLLELAGNTTITTLNGTGTVDFSAVPITLQVANGNYAGMFVGTSSLDKVSGGTLVLSGFSNSFSGDVNVLGGILEAQSDRALGTGLVRLGGGNLAITGDAGLLLGNNIEQLSGATVTLGAATVGATAFTQSLGNLAMYNGVTLTVQQDGTFAAGAPATLSVGTVTLDDVWTYSFNVGAGAKLEVRGAVNGSANNDLFVVGAGDTTITGNLNIGSGDLYKFDTGTLRLLSANTFSGNVDVYGGTLITANNGLQNVPQIYIHSSGTLNGVNYKTDADLAIDQGGTATFSAAAPAITGTIWNNGSLTLNPALGGNSTITLNEFYGSGTTTITRGNLVIYNNALTLGPSVLDPITYNNTLPADQTWGYGAGGGGNNVLNLIGTLTADISGGTVNTTNLFANYIFDVDMLGDYLNSTTGRPLGIAGPAMGGTNVFLNVNVSGSATVGTIAVDGTGTVNFAGTAEVVTLENGQVNLTGTLGEFTNVEGGAITSTSADVKITHLTGGTHSFNGQSTTITNFTGGTAALNGVQSLVTTFGGTAAATATSNISVGTMSGGSLTLQGSGPSSFITRLSGGTLNINGSDVLVTVNAGNGAGADITGNGSLTKLTVATLNLNTINLSGTIRHQEGVINVWGDDNSLGTVINSSTLSFVSNTGSNSIASLDNNSTGVINFATDSSIGALSGAGVLTINDATKTLTIQSGSFSGTISGTGNLLKSNTGILVLSGTSVDDYTGETTINGGTLEFSSAVTLTGAVNNSGAVLRFTSATGTATLSSLTNNFGGSTVFTGASNVGTVLNANGASLTFNGSTNITVGLLNLAGSYVDINAGGSINILSGDGLTRINNVGVSINQRTDNGELQINNNSSFINQLIGNGRITLSNATLSVNEGATAGTIEGNGNLTKNSGGLLTLSGANVDNYSGSTTVNNGTLEFTHDAVTLAGPVSVGASGTLDFTAVTGTTQLSGGLVTSGNTTIGNNAILADTYNNGNTLSIVGNVTGSYFQNSNASATTVIGGTANLSHFRNYWGVMNINALVGSSSIGFLQNWGSTTMVASLMGNNLENHAGITTIGGNATLGDVRTYGGTTSIGGNLINCNYLENHANTRVFGAASISSLRNNSGTTTIDGNATLGDVRTYSGATFIGGNLINCNYLENYATTQVSGNAAITSLRNNAGTTTIGGTLNASDVVNNGGQLIVVTGNAIISNYLENIGTANFGSTSTIASLFGSGTANFAGASQIANRSGNGTANFAEDSSISSVSGDGSLTIASGKTLTISGGSFSGSVSGQGALTKNSASTLTLSGSNVDGYQGSTTVNAGTLVFDTDVTLTGQVTNNQATLLFTSATGTNTLSSLTNNFGGSTIFTGASNVTNVINANGSTLQFNGSTNITGGLDNGTGSLVEINAGGTINTLSGDGLTRINNVGVSINQRSDNGELQINSSSSINQLFGNGRITLSNATLSVNEGTTAGIIDGNGYLTKNSGSLLILSGANVDNYTGNTTVNNGSLQFDHNGVFLAGQVSVGASGTLNFTASTGTTQLNGGLVTSGNTTIGNNAILSDTYNHANNLTIVGNVTGSYFENSSASSNSVIGGTANLSTFRSYWGAMNINGLTGSSTIGTIQNWGSTTIVADLSSNWIENQDGSTTIGGNATISNVYTYGGTTSIGGNLTNCNYLENYATTQVSGDASISVLRNYSGTTTIGGNLVANDVVNNGGQLIVVTGNANITSQIENNGTANFDSTSSIWSLWGSGTANFAGAAQIQYRTGNGTANFADHSNVWSLYGDGSVTVASGKTLTLSTNYFWGSLSGDGSISKITGDTLVLGGSNVDGYQGSTTVNAGDLVFDTASTLAGQVTNNAILHFSSGSGLTTLTTGLAGSGATYFAGDTSVGTLNGTGDATVSIANGKTLTVSNGSYAGLFTGAGSLVKANGGTLVFTGVNADDYQGSTTVDAGALTFTQAVTLAGQVTNNATLNFTNAGNTALTTGLAGAGATSFSGDTSVGALDGTNTASVSIAGGKVLTVSSGNFAGSLTGGGSLVKSTGGSLTLSGAGAGNYVGTTLVDAGTLEFIQDVSLFGAVTNNSTLNFGGAGTTTLTGGLTGSGTTTFSGNGSITSRSGTGVVNFLGNVSIDNVTGSGDLNIASGKSLTIEQGVYSGSITGSGDLVKTTGGELELIGSSSNYGATVVQAGLLTINSDVTTSGVIVAAGASLGGSGSINGNVVVNGFLAPGNSPGVLTVNGTETLANNSTFQAEIGGSTAGSGDGFHDQSNVIGNVVIGTGVDLDLLSWNGFTSVARGDALTLVKATGGIAGRFADTVGSGLTGWTLFDNSSDAAHQFGNLYGTGLSAGQTFGAWGTNANRTAVAGALWTTAVTETTNSATTAGANRVGFIDTNSNAGRAALALVNAGANTDALLDSYSPESFLGLSDYAQMTARTLADGALNQTTSYTVGDWGVGAGYTSVANTYIAGSSRAFDRRLSSNTTYANFSYLLNPRWKASLFFGHNVGSINSAANSTNLNGNVVGLSLNGSVDWHYPVSLKAAITSSSLRFGSNRTMTTATSGDDQIVSGTGTSSAADTKLTDTSAQVSASMLVYTKGRLSLSPTVGLVYGSSKTDAFTETGTGANLAVAGMSSNSTRGVIGLGVGYEVSAELALSMSLGFEKQLNSDADSVSATFAGARDANFSVVGRDTSGSVTSTLGFGLSYRLPEGYSANLNAEFRNASSFDKDKRVNLSINRRF